jgi:hypothetical protein
LQSGFPTSKRAISQSPVPKKKKKKKKSRKIKKILYIRYK